MAKKKDAGKQIPKLAGPFGSKLTAELEHDHELTIARYSPCGKFLFAASYDGNIYRWAFASNTEGELADPAAIAAPAKTTLSGHKGWVQGLAFHPDGKRIFTGDSWGNIICWNYADPAPKPLWTRAEGHRRWMRSLAISPDGATLATAGADRVIKLWSTADGAPVWESPEQPDSLFSVVFHPKGDLIVGDLKGIATQWDLSQKKSVRKFDAKILYLRPLNSGVLEINEVGGIRATAFDSTGSTLACAGAEPVTSGFFTCKPTIVLIDWESGKQKQIMQWDGADPQDGITLDVAWTKDGVVLGGSSGQARVGALYAWKPGDKAPIYLEKKMANCRSIALHPDGKKIAVAQVQQAPGQAGNGRHLKEKEEYLGFVSRVRLFSA